MAALTTEVKAFIVQGLACFDTPTQVAQAVKQEFGIDVTRQQVAQHDPTKVAGINIATKWKTMFEEVRNRFREETSDIPIANKAYRLRALDRMAAKAEGIKNMALAAQLMEQAAKEMGGAYTNRQQVDHTNSDGSMTTPTRIELVAPSMAADK